MILCIFRLESLLSTPIFSLFEYNASDFFCSIELMVFVAGRFISFLICFAFLIFILLLRKCSCRNAMWMLSNTAIVWFDLLIVFLSIYPNLL